MLQLTNRMPRAGRHRVIALGCSLTILLALAGGCDKDGTQRVGGTPDSPRAPDSPVSQSPALASSSPSPAAAAPALEDATPCPDLAPVATRLPAVERLVAIGDIHGDIQALREVLGLAGAVDDQGNWAGGELVIVQTGDILDRGDDERAILDWLARLRTQARAAGGAIHLLNGNHELMNASFDFRYVTEGGMRAFADLDQDDARASDTDSHEYRQLPVELRGRARAFRPGGPYARAFADNNVILVVGDMVFAHGGVLAEHAAYGLERINHDARCFLADPSAAPSDVPESAFSAESPVWTRRFSRDPPDCEALSRALDAIGARRMIVGHTPQEHGITSMCEERVWRIDTGMSAHYGGVRQALEVRGSEVRVLGLQNTNDDRSPP